MALALVTNRMERRAREAERVRSMEMPAYSPGSAYESAKSFASLS